MRKLLALSGLMALSLMGCKEDRNEPAVATSPGASAPHVSMPAPAPAPLPPKPGSQAGGGRPYEVLGSEVWDVPDPVSGRTYQVFVALPKSYAEDPARRYPVLYVTDADYAFPLIRQIGRRLNIEGPKVQDFILVGLSYAVGEDGMPSRRRDYTPTAAGTNGAPDPRTHGQAEPYIAYLRDQVLPFVAQRYRTDEQQRLFLGHSYGSLLGTQILVTQPQLFSGYILGSPSYWYDGHVMDRMEAAYAKDHTDLPARVYLYVGQYEAPSHGQRYDMVADTQRMARTLRGRRYPSLQVTMEVLNDEDHLSVAPRGFTHGLKVLLENKGG
jgi:predicted alpha/beta superfamily hydrolase